MASPISPCFVDPLNIPAAFDGWLNLHRPATSLYPRHRHEPLEFNLGVSGSAVNDLGGRRYPIGPGVLTWLFPDQDHQLVEQSRDFAMWVVVIRPVAVQRWCRMDPLILRSRNPPGHHSRRLADEDIRNLNGLLGALSGLLHDPVAANAGLGFLLRAAWAMHGRSPELPATGSVHPAVARAAVLQADQLSLTGEELAARTGMSRARLSHLFHQQMGETLQARRERLRVEAFLGLRRQSQRRTMLADALRAGFGSYAQFHRSFFRIMGVNARSWHASGSHYG